MKKYTIHYNYYATADVTVLAKSKEEAIEKADQIELSNDEFDLQFDTREVYGFDVELAELTDIEQLNVAQIIIDAAKDNGIEL